MGRRGLGLCGLAGALTIALAGPARTAPAARQDGGTAPTIIRKDYRWTDINAGQADRWPEASAVVHSRQPYRQFTTEIFIPVVALRAAIASFGIPRAWLTIAHQGADDLRAKLVELRAKAAPRGIVYRESARAFTADYAWMAERSREDVSTLSRGLFEAAKTAGYGDELQLLGLLASFIQALAHTSLPAHRTAPDGTEMYVGGVAMPLETLATGAGDCDSKCVLLGAILAHLKGARMILLLGGDHVFAGVRGVPRPRDRYVRIKNDRYILIELTSRWPVGRVPAESRTGLEVKKLEIIPLVGFGEGR